MFPARCSRASVVVVHPVEQARHLLRPGAALPDPGPPQAPATSGGSATSCTSTGASRYCV